MAEISKYVLFKLRDQLFAVDVFQVISIERVHEITNVPRTSRFIKGVATIRDVTTPIIDLKERLLMTETDITENSRILVVNIKGMQIGLIVDAASTVLDIEYTTVEPAPKIIGGVEETYTKGIAKLDEGLLIILDLDSIINEDESKELQKVSRE